MSKPSHNGVTFLQALLAALMLTAVQLGLANEGRRVPTIGLAIPVDPSTDAPFQRAFRDGLRDLGYVDGKNVALIVRYSNGDPGKLREIIRELIELKVDVLMGDAPQLKEATRTIPIVSPTMANPVKTGLVASLSRPGGNITGLSSQRYDIDPKVVELTKELFPDLRRLGLLLDDARERDLEKYADHEFRRLTGDIGVSLRILRVRTPNDVRAVPKVIDHERLDAVIVWESAFLYQHRRALLDSLAHRLPVIGSGKEMVEAGAVFSYSVDWQDMFRRSAAYVDKILRGAKPGELPIEQPKRFELIVNLRAAKALGIAIPESILLRADEIIR
jgi:putative tryptophan/tyrosine transport system substrate-binding protein